MPRLRPVLGAAGQLDHLVEVRKGVTGATGPKISSRYAGASTGTSPSTVGR
jgi:hypothetical protein